MPTQGPLQVQSGSFLSGLEATSGSHLQQLLFNSDTIIQGHRVLLGELKLTVYTVLGAHDTLEVPYKISTILITINLDPPILPVTLHIIFNLEIQHLFSATVLFFVVCLCYGVVFFLLLISLIHRLQILCCQASHEESTFLNHSWADLYKRTGIR